MTERKKPDFEIDRRVGLDPNFLPDRLRNDLAIELRKSKLAPEQQLSMLEFANELAQRPNTYTMPISTEKNQIEAVEKEARRLLSALNKMSPQAIEGLSQYAREALFVRPSPLPVEMIEPIKRLDQTGLLDQTWDWVDALASAAEYANSQLEAPKTDGPKLSRSRWLVANLATHHLRLTATAPPADPAAWFSGFVSTIADHLNLRVGADIIRSGIASSLKPLADDSAQSEG